MEADNNSMGGGDDLYSDKMDGPEPPKPEMDEDKGGDSEEAIIPRSICGGMDLKVGDKLPLEVTAIHDKEISVKYVAEKDEDKGGSGTSDDDKAAVPAGMADDDPNYN